MDLHIKSPSNKAKSAGNFEQSKENLEKTPPVSATVVSERAKFENALKSSQPIPQKPASRRTQIPLTAKPCFTTLTNLQSGGRIMHRSRGGKTDLHTAPRLFGVVRKLPIKRRDESRTPIRTSMEELTASSINVGDPNNAHDQETVQNLRQQIAQQEMKQSIYTSALRDLKTRVTTLELSFEQVMEIIDKVTEMQQGLESVPQIAERLALAEANQQSSDDNLEHISNLHEHVDAFRNELTDIRSTIVGLGDQLQTLADQSVDKTDFEGMISRLDNLESQVNGMGDAQSKEQRANDSSHRSADISFYTQMPRLIKELTDEMKVMEERCSNMEEELCRLRGDRDQINHSTLNSEVAKRKSHLMEAQLCTLQEKVNMADERSSQNTTYIDNLDALIRDMKAAYAKKIHIEELTRAYEKLKKRMEPLSREDNSGTPFSSTIQLLSIAAEVENLEYRHRKSMKDMDELVLSETKNKKELNQLKSTMSDLRYRFSKDRRDYERLAMNYRLENTERDLNKLFKFQLAIIFLMGILLYWSAFVRSHTAGVGPARSETVDALFKGN